MRRVVAIALIVGLPVVWLLLAFFGGGQVRNCLGLHGCGLPAPDTSGPLDEPAEVLRMSIAFAAAWVAVLAVSLRYLWSVDRRRVRRVAVTVAGLAASTGFVMIVVRLVGGAGKRIALEDAGLFGLIVVGIILPVAVIVLLATIADRSPRD